MSQTFARRWTGYIAGCRNSFGQFDGVSVRLCRWNQPPPEPLFRAVFTKGQIKSGQNVLITGIGGGVALQALQFVVAAGALFSSASCHDQLDQ